MPTWLVTGGAGFIGGNFVLRAVANGVNVINLDALVSAFPGKTTITLDDIYARGIVRMGAAVKILSRGDVSTALSVEAHKFSQAAADKIRQAGGNVTELEAVTAAE